MPRTKEQIASAKENQLEGFKELRPIIRSVGAFIIFVAFKKQYVDVKSGVADCYSYTDHFLDQLENDLRKG